MPAEPFVPQTRPMAFLSDIHGNLAALKAVLTELQRRGIGDIFVAGDLLYGGDEPLEVWLELQKIGARCTRGLSDMALAALETERLEGEATKGGERERALADRFLRTRTAVGDLVLERLRRLPEKIRLPLLDGGELVMVHGSPADPSEEIGHDLDDDEIRARIGDDPADIVVCGSTHVPFDRAYEDLRIVNVGSVGSAPEGRIAHFTVITPRVDGSTVEQAWVEY
jgi:predicted phosphodiesterase